MRGIDFFKEYVLKIFIICFAGFIALGFIAYFICNLNIAGTAALYSQLQGVFDAKGIIGDSGDISCFKLFLNNLQSTGISFAMGAVPFFFLPVLVLLINGGVMGVVFSVISAYSPGSELSFFAAGMLPHGIFEIPAICLGTALGITLCIFECQKILNRGRMAAHPAGDFVGNLCKIFIFVCIPLLIVAALIESFITPLLLNSVL